MQLRGSRVSEDECHRDRGTGSPNGTRAICERGARRHDIVDEHDGGAGDAIRAVATREPAARAEPRRPRPAALRITRPLAQRLDHRAIATRRDCPGKQNALIETAFGSPARRGGNRYQNGVPRQRARSFSKQLRERLADVAPPAFEGEDRAAQVARIAARGNNGQARDGQGASLA
jgi:hypothetical protein